MQSRARFRVLAAFLMTVSAGVAYAQAPQAVTSVPRQVRFVVPFPAEGTLDFLARTISDELGPALGTNIVVENRPCASGVLGADQVARATADGGTLLVISNTFVTLPAMTSKLPFDIVKEFEPVIELGGTPTVITVHPSFPARNMKSLIEAAKTIKGGVNYSSPGIASPPHLAGELLARAVDVPFVHVPYRDT
jgi:tripartite-type tricarboxylate transporter receptor subunit TctC